MPLKLPGSRKGLTARCGAAKPPARLSVERAEIEHGPFELRRAWRYCGVTAVHALMGPTQLLPLALLVVTE